MRNSESMEMYLEVIYDIYLKGNKIRVSDISKELGYTKPSVNRGINALSKKGYVNTAPYQDIVLTESGIEYAKKIAEKHNLIKQFLLNSLDISVEIADEDACRIEHVISDESIEAIKKYLKNS